MATLSPMVSMAPIRGHEDERGQEGPEGHPEAQVEPGPVARGQADPARLGDEPGVVDAIGGGRPRSPETMPMTGAQRRQTPAARRVTATVTTIVTAALTGAAAGEAPSGTWVSMSKTMGMTVTAISMITVPHTVGVKSRRSSASRNREGELHQGPRPRPATRASPAPPSARGGDADRDEGARGAHHQDVARADLADAEGLEHRGDAADRERGEGRPRQVVLAGAGRPHHDGGGHDDSRDGEHRVLESQPQGKGVRRLLVGLVADASGGVGGVRFHHGRPVSVGRQRARWGSPLHSSGGASRLGPGNRHRRSSGPAKLPTRPQGRANGLRLPPDDARRRLA